MAGISNIRRPWAVALVAMGVLGAAGASARADRIVLRGGTRIRGVVVPSPPSQRNQVLVLTETLTTPIKYRKDQVVEVISEPSALNDYVAKRDRAEASAQGQYDLGLWCEQNKLLPYAELHYRRAVELDNSFAPAHKKLGHVLHEGRWVTNDELREAQGLVKVRGKWVSKEEKAKIEGDAAEAADRASWTRRLKVLRSSLLYGTEERRREAEDQLAAIRDPAAVQPLIRAFGEDADEVRILLAKLLGAIPGPEASTGLLSRLLAETEQSVRQATLDELARREDPKVVPQLVKALQSKDLAVVNRAAWALGNLNAVAAVPKLVQALLAIDQRIVWVPSGGTGGGGGTGVGASFYSAGAGGVPTAAIPGMGPIGPVAPPMVTNGPVIGMSGFNPLYGMSSVAVGPGVVAFGAGGGYPIIAGGAGSNFSVGFGDNGGSGRGGLEPRMIRNTYRNVEVLNALQKLTGQNFGYDVPAWRHWLSTGFRPNRTPARQVPQP